MKQLSFYIFLLINVCFASIEVIANQQTDEKSSAQVEFSRASFKEFISVSQQIANLRQQYSEIGQFSGGFESENRQKVIELLEQSSAYPAIRKILEASEFSDLESVFNFAERMLAMTYYRSINKTEGADPFQTVKILEITLENLKANHSSEKLINEAEYTLSRQKEQAKVVRSLLDTLTDKDKLFIESEEQWLDKQFP